MHTFKITPPHQPSCQTSTFASYYLPKQDLHFCQPSPLITDSEITSHKPHTKKCKLNRNFHPLTPVTSTMYEMKGIVIKTRFTRGTLIQHSLLTLVTLKLTNTNLQHKKTALWNDLESLNKVNIIKWQHCQYLQFCITYNTN